MMKQSSPTIAIADSGATKTHWCFLDKTGQAKEVVTGGLNPFMAGEKLIRDCLEKDLYPFIDNTQVTHLFFYGSGCADASKRTVLQAELEGFFRHAEVEIESDLAGAAIALCGKAKGLVAILGTGAATCFYNGERIVRRIASLGYVLGDEGSGARIGIRFLSDYLREGMPEDLREEFAPFCPYPLPEIIDQVYHGQQVGRMLGEMAVFASLHNAHPYVRQVLDDEFRAFFAKQVKPYGELLKETELNLLGSVAFHAQDSIREVAESFGVRVGKVLKGPMEGLLAYYRPMLPDLLRAPAFDEEDDFS